jgi:hypothetical protein
MLRTLSSGAEAVAGAGRAVSTVSIMSVHFSLSSPALCAIAHWGG